MPTTLTLGRDPAADFTIADTSVSRRHAELVLLDDRRIFVRDLGTANGTARLRNGQRTPIQRDVIAPGDDVAFGDIILSFDMLHDMLATRLGRTPAAHSPAAAAAVAGNGASIAGNGAPIAGSGGGAAAANEDARKSRPHASASGYTSSDRGDRAAASFSDFIPLVGGVKMMRERRLLLPAVLFVIALSRLMWLFSKPTPENTAKFVVEFSLMLVGAAFVVVYMLCGKRKPWTTIAAVMAAEALVMSLHSVLAKPFCDATGAGDILARMMAAAGGKGEMPGTLAIFWGFFTCAGLLEELEKMLPVFGLIWFASSSRRADAKRWGVFEPLDAIVYACAAAATFIVLETFGAKGYVGGSIEAGRAADKLTAAALMNFPLAIIRTFDALSGHLAYSGYFAYFVGLGLLRKAQRERLWLGGWIGAALIHGFFNTFATNNFLTVISTAVAFFCLMTAILHARRVSPTRDENFATRALRR
jgi:RsiW-degrading membrane proteinase PrsW (M82 family)